MGDPQYLEKQKIIEQIMQAPLLEDQSVDQVEEPEVKQNKLSEKEKRIKDLSDDMETFGLHFMAEWGNDDVVVDASLVRKSMDVFTKSYQMSFTSRYSMEIFAGGRETNKLDEKRSDTAVDLMDSMSDWYEMTKSGQKVEMRDRFDKLYELAQSADNYCLTHDKLFFWTSAGKGRALIAQKVRDMTTKLLDSMLTDKEKEDIKAPGDADYLTGENLDSITDELEKNAKAYQNYKLTLAKNCQGCNHQEMLDRKLRVLRLSERQIKVYRRDFKGKKRNETIDKFIREYEECIAWEKLRSLTRKEGEVETGYDEIIDEHLEKEGEIKNRKDEKVPVLEKEEGLSPAQLKGIEEIDKWLVRNFRNGGLLGKILPFTKNSDEGLMEEILSLSKRERLHIYYLVEKQKRRNSNITDVGMSQTYEPDLKAFKGQILASRAKFWKRLQGGYTYMDKLSDAYHVMSNYRGEIKAVAEFEIEQKKSKQEGEVSDKKEAPVDAVTKRYKNLIDLKKALEALNEDAKKVKEAKSKRQKAGAEAKLNESKQNVTKLMNELVASDNDVEKENIFMTKSQTTADEVNEDISNYKVFGGVPGGALQGIAKGSDFLKLNWNLKDTKWTTANSFTGSLGETISGATAILGVVTTMISLCKTGDQMSGADVSELTMNMVNSLASVAGNVLNIKNIADTGGVIFKTAEQTAQTKLIGSYVSGAGAVLNTGIAVARAAGYGKMKYHGKKAGDYFKQKREQLMKEEDKLTLEQKRELKYEENMMKLQEKLMARQGHRAIYSGVSAGLGFAGAFFPPIGFLTAVGSIVTSIADSIEVGKLRTQLFDSFFNLDELADKIAAKRYAGDRRFRMHNMTTTPNERIKEALRKRVAGRAGFHDMKTATEFVCSKFARMIRDKIFKNNNEDEKKHYIEFVKALNLRYNEEKQLPDEHTLVRKMTAQ